jgi:N-acetylneuraminate synthase
MQINIAGRIIGPGNSPFIIAEMSGNHNHSLDRALEIVVAAAKSGAHALKIQTYLPETMTLNKDAPEFRVDDKDSPWYGRSLFELYSAGYTPWEWHKPIFELAKRLNLICFSTPFDESAIEFLETLNVPCYKVASFEIGDIQLIRGIAKTGKPLIISTGMASIAEIDDAVKAARESGCTELILLKCTSTYPASPLDTNILTIPNMKQLFKCEVGISDHTLGIGVSLASLALGASVIEKHFTLSRADGGVDSTFSLEPSELKQLVEESNRAWQALGTVSYGPSEAEKKSLIFRRSLYIVKDLVAGDVLTKDNIRAIRPGFGLAPKNLEMVLGRRVVKNTPSGTALNWDILFS